MSLSFKESLNQISSGDFIGNGGNWQNHPSYTHSDIYTDRSISTISSKKNIRLNSRQFNITQEENSQYIPFEMPRFYDGLDLVNATISIHYETSGERHGAAQPINVIYNDNKIRFGWLIDSNVTSDPGKLKFEIHAYGVTHGANGETTAYVWKSKSNEKLNVLQSICETDEVITAVDDSWVQELVTDIAEHVAESLKDVALNEQVQAAVRDAKQYADDLNATTSNKIESIDKEIDVIFDKIENFSKVELEHNHKISNIDGLQVELDNKASLLHDHDGDYDAKGAAVAALEAAKYHANDVAGAVRDDLLNGAGPAYDTLKELGELINENQDAIGVLEKIAVGKADKIHTHDDLYYTESEINNLIAQKSQVQIITWEADD